MSGSDELLSGGAGDTVRSQNRNGTPGPLNKVRRSVLFVTVTGSLFMSSLDGTIVAIALPNIRDDLGASFASAGWTITAYSLALIISLPLAGSWSDKIDPKILFNVSVIVFIVASAGCFFAPKIEWLIVFRSFQALGGAGFTPTSTRLVVDHFGSLRGKAIGLFGGAYSFGAISGPLIGGLILANWSWRMIFLINVPVGIVLLTAGLIIIPRRSRERSLRLPTRYVDVKGLALLVAAVGCLMLALTSLDGDFAQGFAFFLTLSFISICAFTAFFAYLRVATDPIIQPRYIYGRGFAVVNLFNVLYSGGSNAFVSLIPIYCITVLAMSIQTVAVLLMVQAFATLICIVAFAAMLRKTGYRIPVLLSGFFLAIGLACVAATAVIDGPVVLLTIAVFAIGAGKGSASPALRNAGLELAPQSAASLAALRTIGIELGIILFMSSATVTIDLFPETATVQPFIYGVASVFVFGAILLVKRIPEVKGRW